MNLDYRGFSNVGRIGDKCYVDEFCDNCGAKYFVMEDDPDVPRLHRVCDTCFMPMVVKNCFYLWKRMAKGLSMQKRFELYEEFEKEQNEL